MTKAKKTIKLKNRTDRILGKKDINSQMNFKDFAHKKEFSVLCDLVPDRKKERLVIEKFDPALIRKRGVLYIFVLDEKLIKIGSTTTSFADRVSSYNCGRRAYRANGTCSTTNYFVLQSLLNINKKVKVYAYFPEHKEMDIFGTTEVHSLPAKRFETKLLSQLKKEGRFPIMCTQQ